MSRTKKTEPKAESTTAEETQKEAPVTPETPKADNVPSEDKNAIEKRLSALETIVTNQAKRIAELERVTAYRKPVTSADILGL